MGNFDNEGNTAIPGGSLAKPVMIALGALLVGRMISGHNNDAQQTDDAAAPVADQSGGGLLGGVLGGLGGLLAGATSSNSAAPATPAAPSGLSGGLNGGLGGLLEQLSQAGHGDTVSSWLGDGENAPIDPTHLGDAIGPNALSQIAQHAGIDPQELLTQLSQALPGVVDKLTAGGKVPDLSELSKMLQNR